MPKINLHHIDCMDFMKEKPDKFYDLAIVDPPYGLGDKLNIGGTWAKKWQIKGAKWDIKPNKKYFDELFRVSKNQIVWGGNYFGLPPNRHFIIWDKISPLPTMADCEYAWSSFNKNAKIVKYITSRGNRIHVTQKPVELYKWILKNYAQPGDKILDTHLGSGSVAIACHDYGYDLDGCEIDAEYFEAAVKRYENHAAQMKLF